MLSSAWLTAAGPTTPAGVVAVMRVSLTTLTSAAASGPNRRTLPETKFAPTMVTGSPPAMSPLSGETASTVGAST